MRSHLLKSKLLQKLKKIQKNKTQFVHISSKSCVKKYGHFFYQQLKKVGRDIEKTLKINRLYDNNNFSYSFWYWNYSTL